MRTTLILFTCCASFASAQEFVTIRGQVKWNGSEPPKREPVAVNARFLPEGVAPPLPTDVMVDAKSLGLQNVVVWLRPDSETRKDPFPPERVRKELRDPAPVLHTITMARFNYQPRVLAVRVGDKLSVINNTRVPNNFKYDGENTIVNVLLQSGDQKLIEDKVRWQWPAAYFGSSIYPWMKGCVRVFDHPYYAVTDGDGKFEIQDAPVGKWRIVYWHEQGFHKGREGSLGFPIEVKTTEKNAGVMELKAVPFEIPSK